MTDHSIDGWDNIAQIVGVSRSTIIRRREEMMAAGVIFYRWKGRPPKKTVSCFPSVFKAWVMKKSIKGEYF